ncbi:MAG: aminomethyltransferase beta-barrel domain-containing protein [Bdellovibrionia bacterium]
MTNIGVKQKVLVGISGGLSSALTAALLKTQGYAVEGAFIDLSSELVQGFKSRCREGSKAQGLELAQRLSEKIGIPLHVIDASALFEAQVMDPSVHRALMNQTFNPCLACTRDVKIRLLFEKAEESGIQWIATGHFAQTSTDPVTGQVSLLKALDPSLDESYFLSSLGTQQVSRLLLPLGGLSKKMIEKIAEKSEVSQVLKGERGFRGFRGFDDESIFAQTKTCFVEEPEFLAFMEKRVAPSLSHLRVIKKAMQKSESEIFDSASGFQSRGGSMEVQSQEHVLSVVQVSWVRPMNQLKGFQGSVKFAPDQPEFPGVFTCFENHTVQVRISEKPGDLLPGMAVAFYQGQEVLGAGILDRMKDPLGAARR